MSLYADAASIIESTLNAIATDELSAPVSGVLREAWNGERFNEEELRRALAALSSEDPTL